MLMPAWGRQAGSLDVESSCVPQVVCPLEVLRGTPLCVLPGLSLASIPVSLHPVKCPSALLGQATGSITHLGDPE